MENIPTPTKVTEKGNNKRKRYSFNSSLSRIRTSMKIASLISIILATTLPFLYWKIAGFVEDGGATQVQAITFIFLVISATVNLVFGVLTFWRALEKTDSWFVESQTTFLITFVCLTFSGAFLLGILYIYMWWQSKKHWSTLNQEK